MKTNKLTSAFTVTFVLTCLSFKPANSQDDSSKTFSVKGFSIYYSKYNTFNYKTVFNKDAKSEIKLDEFSELKFMSDSIIKVSNTRNSDETKIPIKNINRIKIETGNMFWMGVSIGTVAGTVAGIILMQNSIRRKKETGNYFVYIKSLSDIAYPALGFILGFLSGGAIGGRISAYDTYDFKKKNKKDDIMKVLKSKGLNKTK